HGRESAHRKLDRRQLRESNRLAPAQMVADWRQTVLLGHAPGRKWKPVSFAGAGFCFCVRKRGESGPGVFRIANRFARDPRAHLLLGFNLVVAPTCSRQVDSIASGLRSKELGRSLDPQGRVTAMAGHSHSPEAPREACTY